MQISVIGDDGMVWHPSNALVPLVRGQVVEYWGADNGGKNDEFELSILGSRGHLRSGACHRRMAGKLSAVSAAMCHDDRAGALRVVHDIFVLPALEAPGTLIAE
jgi:hypothetical protein